MISNGTHDTPSYSKQTLVITMCTISTTPIFTYNSETTIVSTSVHSVAFNVHMNALSLDIRSDFDG